MTMFNKVFGSQMGAAQDADKDDTPKAPRDMAPCETALPIANPLLDPDYDGPTLQAQEIKKLPPVQHAKPAAPQEPDLPLIPTPPPAAATSAMRPAALAPAPTARPVGNARTRLLGFGAAAEAAPNPMAGPTVVSKEQQFPTGWIVIVDGPGRGHFFPLFTGVSTMGREDSQAVVLDFGDMTISRENHAAIAYDTEDNQFYVGHGGKSNIVRLNDRPLLSTEPLSHGDTLRLGETVLRFAAFCGADFDWATKIDD